MSLWVVRGRSRVLEHGEGLLWRNWVTVGVGSSFRFCGGLDG